MATDIENFMKMLDESETEYEYYEATACNRNDEDLEQVIIREYYTNIKTRWSFYHREYLNCYGGGGFRKEHPGPGKFCGVDMFSSGKIWLGDNKFEEDVKE